MPHYFFHVCHSDSDVIPDDEGEAFADLDAARREAAESLRDLVVDAIRSGRKTSGLAIRITDEAGVPLDTVRAREAIP